MRKADECLIFGKPSPVCKSEEARGSDVSDQTYAGGMIR
jgi:hypothetical protein